MTDVRHRPTTGQESATARARNARLDWGDTRALKTWATEVLTQARDALGAGEDATRAPGERELGRRAARRIITEADGKIAALAREVGLDAGAP